MSATDARLSKVIDDAVREATGIDLGTLSDAQDVADLGLDSIGTTQLVLEIEDRMGLHLSDAQLIELSEATTVGEFRNVFQSQVDGLAPAVG